MTAAIGGVISPVLTPIASDGSVAVDRVADSVDFALECGCHAIVASGTGSQETASLAPAERKALISATIEAVDGEVPVLGGVSYPAQPVVSDLIDHAESEGADAVIAMPPWGDVPSDAAVVRYYEQIAAETDLPVAVYNNPTLSVDMSRETMRRVARIDGVAHMKESRRDWQKISWLVDRVQREGLCDIHTTMDVFVQTMQAGGSGAFVPAPATVPAVESYEALQAGDVDRALDRQRAFTSFPPAETNGFISACKAAAAHCGYDLGDQRPPFDPVTSAGRAAMETWLERHAPDLVSG